VFSVGIDLIMNLFFKSTEGGARTLVLAALAKPDENGHHYTNYQSYKDHKKLVLYHVSSLRASVAKNSIFRAAYKSVFGPEGQKIQAEVWKEVVGILEKEVPQVKEILRLGVV
jgi:hypothetical protein